MWKNIENYDYEISEEGNVRSSISKKVCPLDKRSETCSYLTIQLQNSQKCKRICIEKIMEQFYPDSEYVKKYQEKCKDKYSSSRKKVCVLFPSGELKEFESMTDAALETGIDLGLVSKYCNGIRKTCRKGFKFFFKRKE